MIQSRNFNFPMRNLFFVLFSLSLLFMVSCKKESFNTSPDAQVGISIDTLRFDTVFVAAGSVTQPVKIYNPNNQKIRLSSVELAGGQQSAFNINVDGTPGPSVNNLEIEANDSLYIFVTVTINPNADAAPFLVNDSIRFDVNGRTRHIQLQAYGQNAHYLRSVAITANTTWDNSLPYVILGGLQVDTGVTLTINPGTRVHLHADAPFVVDGSLIANGTKTDSITFQGDRLDKDYADLPGSWPGIFFRRLSSGNILRYTIIKNAYRGIVCDQLSVVFPKLDLHECTIYNILDAGITGINTSIRGVNCLVYNCALNILLSNGGNYDFSHCTVASYSDVYIQHKKPVIVISNWDSTGILKTYDLQAQLRNNIFWGESGNVEDEVVVSRKGSNPFSVLMENNLFKAVTLPSNTVLVANLVNTPPLFDSINESSHYFNFRISKNPSPAIDAGKNLGIATDLDGKPRDAKPDIGSYEKQ
jgi:hypothetical protein